MVNHIQKSFTFSRKKKQKGKRLSLCNPGGLNCLSLYQFQKYEVAKGFGTPLDGMPVLL